MKVDKLEFTIKVVITGELNDHERNYLYNPPAEKPLSRIVTFLEDRPNLKVEVRPSSMRWVEEES